MTRFTPTYKILDDHLFQQFCIERNLKPESRRNYKKSLFRYCEYNQMTLKELYDEADNEEERGVRAKNRKVVQRLRGFRTHLIQQKYAPVTITNYYAAAKSFYTHFLIEVPKIPSIKLPTKQVRLEEIPKKKDLIELLSMTNNLKHQAIIHFMASSGTARNEVCSITIQDFIDATSEYHNCTQIYDVVQALEQKDNIIPVFSLTRIKTGYKYYTVCTPEATKYILRYLRTRPLKRLRPTQTLFELKPSSLTIFFERLSLKAGYPKGFLHPHSLRKYHADILQNRTLTDRLQGRKPDALSETYFKANPKHLKKEYMKHVEDLTLKPTKLVTIEDEAVTKLKNELERERKENKELKKDVDDLRTEVKKFGEMLTEMFHK